MTDNTEPTIEAILDKLWKDAWGKLGAYNFDGTGEDTLTKPQAQEAIERIISDQVSKARIDERSQAQQYLHGLTITPENQHLFDVLSRNNYDRIKELKRSKE